MLMHQFILAAVAAVRRFDSHLVTLAGFVRKVASRVRMGGSDLQET